ncbi:MAG: 3-isopropylmalate dehydratase small subunit, partial [Thermovirga sp.]|nr:3-isopropylmalate dehydratase small subunit [Thermovirga sp.]
ILECPEAAGAIKQGDELEVDLSKGKIKNLSTGQSWNVPPLPDFLQDLMEKGGLVNWVRERLKREDIAK